MRAGSGKNEGKKESAGNVAVEARKPGGGGEAFKSTRTCDRNEGGYPVQEHEKRGSVSQLPQRIIISRRLREKDCERRLRPKALFTATFLVFLYSLFLFLYFSAASSSFRAGRSSYSFSLQI